MGRKEIVYLVLKAKPGDIKAIYNGLQKHEFKFDEDVIVPNNLLTFEDGCYPSRLQHVRYQPLGFFYEGDPTLLLSDNIVSVVGSRDCDEESLIAIDKIIKELSLLDSEVIICSGLAYGIDTKAHEAALKYGLKTIAVLPTALDDVYPPENLLLYKRIKEEGLVITEVPNGYTPKRDYFAYRNRIIVGLGRCLVVGEIKPKSGTSVSVSYALDMGKDIYCLPNSIFKETYNNQLLKEGANVLTSGRDLMKK